MEALPSAVVAGLVPAAPIAVALRRLHIAATPCLNIRGRQDKPGDDTRVV